MHVQIPLRQGLGLLSRKAKKPASLMRATLTASATPPIQSRGDRVVRKSESLSTATGGAKTPRKFFWPKALMLFLTPMAASAWARTVVGTRISRTPRWAVAAAKPGHVDEGAAAHGGHIGVAAQARRLDGLLQDGDVQGVVFHCLAPRQAAGARRPG